MTIGGEEINTGTTPASFVKVIATLYDAEGNVVGVEMTYTTLDEIAAGDTSPFQVFTKLPTEYDHVELQVQGD